VFQKEVKTIYCREFFRVLSGIQWSPAELLWVVRGMQQRPTILSMVKTQVRVITLVPRLPLCMWGKPRNETTSPLPDEQISPDINY